MLSQLAKRFCYLIVFFFPTAANAQSYGDPEFYVTSQLDLDLVNEHEKVKLDSILQLYHQRDKADDTLQFHYLEMLVNGFESGDIEGLYRLKILELAKEKDVTKVTNSKSKKRLYYSKGFAYGNVAIKHLMNGDQDSALFFIEHGIPFMNKSDSVNFQAIMYNLAGLCCKNLGRTNEAIDYCMKGLHLVEESKDTSAMGNIYNVLAGLNRSLGNYEKSKQYFDKALSVLSIDENPSNYGIGLVNKAELMYANLGDTVGAKELLILAESLVDTSLVTTGDKRLYKSVTTALGLLYLSENNGEKAAYYYSATLETANLLHSELDKARALIGLSNAYFLKGEYQVAKKNALDALGISKAYNMLIEESAAHKSLYKIHKNLGNVELALIDFEKHTEIEKLLKQQEEKKNLLSKDFQYDYTKKTIVDSLENKAKVDLAKSNENLALEKEQRANAQLYVAISIVVLVAIFLWVIFSRLKIIREQKKKLDAAYLLLEESKKNELAASNLKAIKSQMNPHFIFNSINSIQDLVLQQETLKSYDYLVVFSKMVRTILDFSEREFIPLDEEVTFLNTYLGLEKLRFQDDFEFKIDVDTKSKSVKIPSLIVQPFAENAIKHGLLHKSGKKELNISFTETDTAFICTIEDNGIGIEEAGEIKSRQTGAHKSFSTDAIEKRLNILEEQTNSKAAYSMETMLDKDGLVIGTKVVVTMPVK